MNHDEHMPQLVTVGRVSVDLYAEQIGEPLSNVTSFRKSIGGTATNVAVAAARLGLHVALGTRVGDDAFGAYVVDALNHVFGVDTRFVSLHGDLATPLAFAEMNPPGDPQIIFYREPRAPDLDLEASSFDPSVIREVPIFWVPASRFSDATAADTVDELLLLRAGRPHTVIDLDWRPSFWSSEAAASAAIGARLGDFTIAIGNREECRIAVGATEPSEAADRLLDRGIQIAVIKLGAEGVMVKTAQGEQDCISAYPVDVKSGLGAGDAFGGAFCMGLLAGWPNNRTIKYANAAGAIVVPGSNRAGASGGLLAKS